MANLKSAIITTIISNLDSDEFCRDDFDVDFPGGSSTLAEIFFRAAPRYSFIIDESYEGNKVAIAISLQDSSYKKVLRTTESPGDYRNDEIHVHSDIWSAVSRIPVWVKNVREDLIHSREVVGTDVDELVNEFQENIDENIDDQDEYFKEDEKDALVQKLNELQKRVSKLEEELRLDPKDTEEIERAIEKSKSDMAVYPKGVWYKTFGTKLIKLLRQALNTKEGREIAVDITKKLFSS